MSREAQREIDLQTLFVELNQKFFSGVLEFVFLRWNSRLRSSAGRFIPGRRKSLFFYESRPTIEIATYLREIEGGEAVILDTLGHEMIHLWLWQQKRPYGHTVDFRKKMREMGVSRYNSTPKFRTPKVLYSCPHCGGRFPGHRKRKNLACRECCQKHSGGRYDSRFKLIIKDWDGYTV